jgi:ATP-dependent RNA helicase RhlE
MPRTIASLAEDYLDDPIQVAVTPAATTVELVDQGVLFVSSDRKRDALATLLGDPAFERVLVFTRTKHGADRVVRHLSAAGIEASAIHGNKSQPQRERALSGFRAGGSRVLVATDIAARGIDVDGISHVINFELPNVPEDYVHRIGRTARAGAAGAAISLCSDEERGYLRDIEKLTRLAVRQLHVELNSMKPSRFPLPQERIESAPARDLRASGSKTGGRKHQAANSRGTQRARRITPSSAAALPVRRSGRVRTLFGPG